MFNNSTKDALKCHEQEFLGFFRRHFGVTLIVTKKIQKYFDLHFPRNSADGDGGFFLGISVLINAN